MKDLTLSIGRETSDFTKLECVQLQASISTRVRFTTFAIGDSISRPGRLDARLCHSFLVYLFIYLSFCLFIWLLINSLVYSFIYLFIYLFIHSFIHSLSHPLSG